MKRRQLLAGVPAVGFTALFRPETFVIRKAVFEEVGDSVLMSTVFPELLRKRDREAVASIDSGFTTTLVFDIAVLEYGTNQTIAQVRRVVELRYHLYLKKYEVVVRHGSVLAPPRYFTQRDAAIDAGLEMRRVRIVGANRLRRQPARGYYYVTVLGQRNPTDSIRGIHDLDPEAGRAQGRDVRWFSRFLDFLAGDVPQAEETLVVRTQPFYLVQR